MDAVAGLFVLFAMSAGSSGVPADLVSLIDPSDYFAARRVDGSVKHLLELVSATPTDARGEFLRLLAIGRLGEEKYRLGGHKETVRRALGRLVEGTDEFARDHARLALGRIDGKPVPVLRRMPKGSLREALAWFPDYTSLAGALDLRAPPGEADEELLARFRRVRALFLRALPETSREGLYQFAETVGDVRLDRLAYGWAPLAEGSRQSRLFLRLTGRMDHKRLSAFLRGAFGRDVPFTEKKGPRGEPITIFGPNAPPALALVGDSDLVLAGYMEGLVDSTRLVREVLAVRGGRPGLLEGPLGRVLREARPGARDLVGGVLPRELVTVLARSPLGVAPLRFTADALALPGAALDLRVRAAFESEADARKFAAGTREQLQEALEALKELPPTAWLLADLVRKVVEGVEVKTSRAEVSIRVQVSGKTCKLLLGMAEAALSFQRPGGGKVPK